MLSIVDASILDATEQYIAHQCNCVTTRSAHLAQALFSRFPHANIYARRSNGAADAPGQIVVCRAPAHTRFVINMLAQRYPEPVLERHTGAAQTVVRAVSVPSTVWNLWRFPTASDAVQVAASGRSTRRCCARSQSTTRA